MSEHRAKLVSENLPTVETQATVQLYTIGFVGSLFLTITAYLLVVHHMFSRHLLIAVVALLAIVQFVVQLLYFLHLGRESKPRWKLGVFFFMLLVVILVVFGSLWIMSNLNYRMTPAQVNQYLNNQNGL